MFLYESLQSGHALQHPKFTRADLQSSERGERTDSSQHSPSFVPAAHAAQDRGEAVLTLNNVSMLEQLGVKTQCEISKKKHVHALFNSPPGLSPLPPKDEGKKTITPSPCRHPLMQPFAHHSPSLLQSCDRFPE